MTTKTILVVQALPDGTETTLHPKEKRPMANPNPNRVKLVKANVERLQASLLRLHDQCGHWNANIANDLEHANVALTGIVTEINLLPAGYVPPRKAIVRGYSTLKVGDHAKITDRAAKHTPATLVGAAMEIVAFEGDIAHVVKDGCKWAVKRSALKLAEAE
jgi:hypothetical protein